MPSIEPRVGNRYLTVTGVPVQIIKVHDGSMVLQGLASDNRFAVPLQYPLQPLRGQSAALPMRSSPYTEPLSQAPPRSAPEPKLLAPIIDALLVRGGLSMRGIVREVRRRAGSVCGGKNIHANVRARLYWLKKKGMVVHRNDVGHISVDSQSEDGDARPCQDHPKDVGLQI